MLQAPIHWLYLVQLIYPCYLSLRHKIECIFKCSGTPELFTGSFESLFSVGLLCYPPHLQLAKHAGIAEGILDLYARAYDELGNTINICLFSPYSLTSLCCWSLTTARISRSHPNSTSKANMEAMAIFTLLWTVDWGHCWFSGRGFTGRKIENIGRAKQTNKRWTAQHELPSRPQNQLQQPYLSRPAWLLRELLPYWMQIPAPRADKTPSVPLPPFSTCNILPSVTLVGLAMFVRCIGCHGVRMCWSMCKL